MSAENVIRGLPDYVDQGESAQSIVALRTDSKLVSVAKSLKVSDRCIAVASMTLLFVMLEWPCSRDAQ